MTAVMWLVLLAGFAIGNITSIVVLVLGQLLTRDAFVEPPPSRTDRTTVEHLYSGGGDVG